ncbi:MAG TPA: HEAT repeat domain-containing protein, partial [Verrucomicrobiae bacterium]|nr:HEAT repeat domain-containing protein [Verrucomicrobiae bacterium]
MNETNGPAVETAPPAGIPPRSAEVESTGEFIISLIQAFLRTGYYLSEHPESRKAKAGLHARFSSLSGKAGELGFILKEEDGRGVVLIEGIAEEALRLTDMMQRGMADTYNPRFAQFMLRKELISLTLSSRMGGEEFSHFIDVMSEPSLSDLKDQAVKERFVAGMEERGVRHISFIFREEMLTSRAGVPWRAALALSRLKKEIRKIPELRERGEDEVRRMLKYLFPDILRPLTEPFLLYAFLMNIDVACSEDLPEESGEERVFTALSPENFHEVTRFFLDDVSGRAAYFPDQLTAERKGRIAYLIYARLTDAEGEEAQGVMEELFNLGLLSPESLPPRIRERVKITRMAGSFAENPGRYLDALASAADPQRYEPMARSLARIVPVLAEKNRWDDAASVLEAFAAHAAQASPRARTASAALAWLQRGASLEGAADAFLKSSKEERTALSRFFLAAGGAAVPHLLRVIGGTSDVWRQKGAGDVLVRLGKHGVAGLIAALDASTLPAAALPATLRTLAATDDPALLPAAIRVVRGKLDDADEEVRREALSALCRLDAAANLPLFQRRLQDRDPRIRKIALRGLALSGKPEALEDLKVVVTRGEHPSHDEEGELAAAALDMLGVLCDVNPAVGGAVAAYALEVGERAAPGGVW